MKKAFLNWSSGKDAAFALHLLQREDEFSIEKLVTTLNSENNRISMHGLREELLLRQVKSLEIPVHIIPLAGNVSMETYDRVMQKETLFLKSEGFTHSVFGDIFLEDLKEYRESQLDKVGLKGVFPLWKRDTSGLIEDFIDEGFRAITVSVNAALLDRSFCGRIIDREFLKDLPEGIDPCGENGEFHTFVFDGPIFRAPVEFQKGEIVQRGWKPSDEDRDNCFSDKTESWDTSFWYCDLLPN